MTAVLLPGDGGLGPSKQHFCKHTQLKSISPMKKIDLLSLFFFDPLHPSLDDLYATLPLITELPNKSNTFETTPHDPTQSTEISFEDHTEPADLSSDASLHDEVDTSSNITDCEPAWCGCTTPCFCDYMDDDYTYEEDTMWDDECLTASEVRSFALEDEWEGRQRTKTQRNGKQLRVKRSEKKDKLWPTRYVHAVCQRKKEEKDAAISDHFERQKNKSPSYVNFGGSNHNNRYNGNNESAEVQRAITLSLTTSTSTNTNNSLACGLSQRQLNDLMNRELTPEDYELLLRLDEAVAKKTVEKSALDKFTSRAATASDVDESACTIS